MSGYVAIGNLELALGAGLLAINLVLSVALRLGIARTLAIAAVRMVVQLALIGIVLEWIFTARQPLAILAIAMVMTAVAAHAAVRRTQRRFVGVYASSFVVILASSFLVTGTALGAVLRPEPWYDPQYVVPLLGMLLGVGVFPGLGVLIGLSMYLPFMYIATYGIGCIANIVVARIKGRTWAEDWGVPFCAGLIVGESVLALLINMYVLAR